MGVPNNTWAAGGEKALRRRPLGLRANRFDDLPCAAFGRKIRFMDCTGDERNLKSRPTRNSKEHSNLNKEKNVIVECGFPHLVMLTNS